MTTGNEHTVPDDITPSPGLHGDPHTSQERQRHPATGRFTRSMASARRDAHAAELFADGYNYEQIATELGYSHRSDAKKAIDRAKADVARPAITRLIATESEELDALYTEAVAILQRNHVTVSHGKVITWRNPETQQEEPLQDDGPKLQAIQVALRVRESYRKLHGLDQPAKQEISGGVKYEVVGVDPEDLT
ncbi:hypothetical protein [Streptomyces griseorubiginosus]|uniref:hypothetical protein n=1 Tax=Streptomyces griseorubiginosus TaxID=67304 RepID=UPI0036E26973